MDNEERRDVAAALGALGHARGDPWRSLEAFEAMRSDPAAQEHMKACAAMAVRFEPILCSVEYAS